MRIAGGCSASVVSPDGLVMTNHHCSHECIEQLSTKKKDFIKEGFFAKAQKDEVKCPDMEINQLVPSIKAKSFNKKVRGLIHLIATTPQYQLV